MVTSKEKTIIAGLARRYKAKRVVLFGSNLHPGRARDIDLAVEGVRPKDFFKLYGDLMFMLPRQVDLVDLDRKSKFTRLIEKEGRVIYG